MSSGTEIATFQRNMLYPFSRFSITEMEAAHTSETLVPIYQSKQCPTTQSCNLNIHCHNISNLIQSSSKHLCWDHQYPNEEAESHSWRAVVQMVLHWGTQKFQQPQLTMDCDPLRWWMCPFPAIPLGPIGPMVPLCVRSCPFWCGNVWNCIALLGSISSRNPSRWNVAYGQISSSIPGMAHQYVKGKMKFIVIRCDERNSKQKGIQSAFTVHERKCLMQLKIFK